MKDKLIIQNKKSQDYYLQNKKAMKWRKILKR